MMPASQTAPTWVPVITEAGWHPVGDAADQSPFPRWPHDRWVAAFAIRDGGRLAVTTTDMARLLHNGRYGRAVGRTGGADLRAPAVMGAAISDGPSAGTEAPFPLSFAEARLVALLLGGRLPLEEEVDILAERVPTLPADLPLWTASPWSAWSYRLTSYDSASGRWRALPDRTLPDAGETSGRVALFVAGTPLRRIRSAPVAADTATDGDGPALGILWLVTSR